MQHGCHIAGDCDGRHVGPRNFPFRRAPAAVFDPSAVVPAAMPRYINEAGSIVTMCCAFANPVLTGPTLGLRHAAQAPVLDPRAHHLRFHPFGKPDP